MEENMKGVSKNFLVDLKQMVSELKKSIGGENLVKIEDLERKYILDLEKRVVRLKSKLIQQGLLHLCRFAERKNRLGRRYFFRSMLKR